MPLLDVLTNKFKAVYIPGKNICIDETLVPFRGKLSFKQYIKNKKHKFGIKLYKLCCEDSYTYDVRVYCGKDKDPNLSAPTKVVMNLIEPLLSKGRTLYTDNFYTSVSLAHQLLERKTHLVGTLLANRKYNPKSVITTTLKKGV